MPNLLRPALLRGAAAAAIASAVAVIFAPGPPADRTRTAIRVDCAAPGACATAEALAVDVWSEQRGPDLPLDVVVSRADLDSLSRAGVTWTVLVDDIDAEARAEAQRLVQPELAGGDWFAEYRDEEEIAAHLKMLADHAPSRAALHSLGRTLDGRTVWALRVGAGGDESGKTPMLINGTQHAREWISAMVTTCVADRLVSAYDDDTRIRQFVDTTELWIVPVVNPDGYAYSWERDRYWRKNRRGGHGVDLNRNFSVAFGGEGSSGLKRSQTYRGDHAFSEPETQALRDLAVREQIELHIDFHAYGQMILYPWNHKKAPTEDQARYAALGDRVASAMFAAHGTQYRVMPGIELYASAGTLTDWVYDETGALSITIELRPRGGVGFVLPPEQIRPTCDEGLAAVLALRAPL